MMSNHAFVPSNDVAVCLTGQLRTLVSHGLHFALQDNLLRPLRADLFMHVDTADTRTWGRQHSTSSDELAAALRVLQPIEYVVQTLLPAHPHSNSCTQTGPASVPVSKCIAHDCGGFKCGCYLPHCTHCDMSTYVPMHEHNRRCFAIHIDFLSD